MTRKLGVVTRNPCIKPRQQRRADIQCPLCGARVNDRSMDCQVENPRHLTQSKILNFAYDFTLKELAQGCVAETVRLDSPGASELYKPLLYFDPKRGESEVRI